jgi:preprotein translocase subunit YajC
MGLIVLILFFVVMWVLFILPQQRRVRQHQQLVQSLHPGEEVVTAGGIYGTIVALDEESVTLEVAPKIEVRVLRGAISRKTTEVAETIAEPIDPAETGLLGAGDEDAWPSAVEDDDDDEDGGQGRASAS